MFSIFSNKGGIGKTSIATNLALELAKTTKEKVALIDLNFQLGDITTFMDLNPSFNISYMLQNLDKINDDFLLSTLENYKQTSLYVLADPPFFKQAEDINPRQIVKLFNMLKETFSYIVVDAESSFDAKNIAALTESDLIFLVTIANLPALRNSQRCLELFDKLGFDSSKTQILLNRYMENDEVGEKDVEKVVGKKIYWKIPRIPARCEKARLARRLLTKIAAMKKAETKYSRKCTKNSSKNRHNTYLQTASESV